MCFHYTSTGVGKWKTWQWKDNDAHGKNQFFIRTGTMLFFKHKDKVTMYWRSVLDSLCQRAGACQQTPGLQTFPNLFPEELFLFWFCICFVLFCLFVCLFACFWKRPRKQNHDIIWSRNRTRFFLFFFFFKEKLWRYANIFLKCINGFLRPRPHEDDCKRKR